MARSVTAPATAAQRSFGRMASAWIPVAICVLVIACESTVYFGADRTSTPLREFCEYLLHRHFTGAQWWHVHMVIRKCGHFTGYGMMSIAWFRAFWMTLSSVDRGVRFRIAVHALAMLGTLLTAASDETHQLFLPNRTGSIYDVMIDCSGGLLMQTLLWIGITLTRSRSNRSNSMRAA